MKFSVKDREQAALALQIEASNRNIGYGELLKTLELSEKARVIANAAFFAADSSDHIGCLLEAEALIRAGWCPGDPVV